ncbi:MAG: fimbrillin family protein [Bacteroidales bacterium]|jgi:hypothetical protein
MRRLLFTISVVLIAVLCTKKTDSPESRITFYGSYHSQTKTSAFLTSGNKSAIYTFAPDEINIPLAGTPIELSASAGGLLTCGNALFLPKGTYDFYSVSLNNNTSPALDFPEGMSGQLVNGVDYLWASVKNSSVNGNTNIVFLYKHSVCKVNISITTAPEITDLYIKSIKYTLPSESGIRMNLKNGIVPISQYVGFLTTLPGSDNSRTFFCLPCSALMVVEIAIDIVINGELFSDRVYRAAVNEDFRQGYMYNIECLLTGNGDFQVSANSSQWIQNSKCTEF